MFLIEDKKLEKQVAKWIEFLRDIKNMSSNSFESYLIDLKIFFSFIEKYNEEKVSLKSLEKLEITSFRSFITNRVSKKISKTSIARNLSSIKSFFKFLENNDVIKNKSVHSITGPKTRKKFKKPVESEDIIEFLNSFEDCIKDRWQAQRDKALFTLIYACGLRISEAINLNISDVARGDFLVIDGKGGKERITPILPIVINEIKLYKELAPFSFSKSEAPLFLGARGMRLTARVAQRDFEKVRNYLGLPDETTPHSLRHSFASDMLNSGVDLRTVQELLGHSSLSTTQIYTTISKKQLAEKFNKVAPK
ncbi:MAG: tyrosine recombinase XerC [Alphaproteobacteria bacterium]|jgi:integrase/recombinase XerC|nr:tyrosine recombinase XerC [Alphaproteobacteria bacterium]